MKTEYTEYENTIQNTQLLKIRHENKFYIYTVHIEQQTVYYIWKYTPKCFVNLHTPNQKLRMQPHLPRIYHTCALLYCVLAFQKF